MSADQFINIPAGDIIFREGDAGDCAYLIDHGCVQIFLKQTDGEVPLRVIANGEVFGEMSLIDSSPRSASCRALTDCRLIIVTKEQLMGRIRAADPVVRLLMQLLMERLRSQNDRLRGRPAPEATRKDIFTSEKKEALQQIELENSIARGLDDDEFIPFYQPIYDLNSGEVRGCEALLRWVTKDKGIVSPAVFMDVLENSWLILKAGRMVIEKAIADLPPMMNSFGAVDNFFVSINISGRQFLDPRFLDHLESCRTRSGLASKHIKLELTERIMTEGDQALATLATCRDLGYQLAVDDFGTGFSSLQYLSQMPLSHLKIDRSFVMRMLTDAKSLSIIQSLIYMADRLGMSLIAEGIETKEQLAMLRALSVSQGQGFLFSKAVPLADFVILGKSFAA